MKKILFILTAILIAVIFSIDVFATEYEYSEGDKNELYPTDGMNNLYESLPEELKNELDTYFKSSDSSERNQALKDKLSVKYWFDFICKKAVTLIAPASKSCASLLAVIIISSVFVKTLQIDSGGTASLLCKSITTIVCALSVAQIAYSAIESVSTYMTVICNTMTAMIPVMEAVMIMSGSTARSTVNGVSLMLYISVSEAIMRYILVPIGSVLLALSISKINMSSLNISSFVSSVKRVLLTLLGFTLLVFSFVLGIQSSLAKSTDTLTMRTIRFALGSYVPFVGGSVAEAISTVTASLSLIRSTTGGVGIIIILLTVLPTLISLFICRLSMLACKCSADLLGDDTASAIISDADSVIAIFCGLAVMTAVFYIFAITLFMNSGSLLGSGV